MFAFTHAQVYVAGFARAVQGPVPLGWLVDSSVLVGAEMIIELLSISAPHREKHELGKALATLIGPIQVQRGCSRCQLFQGWPAEDELQMEARWCSKEDLISHLQSDIYKKLLLLMELSSAPPVLEFFTVLEIRGLDLVEAARISPE